MVLPSNNAEECVSSANSATGAQNSIGMDYNHPLFLHPSDINLPEMGNEMGNHGERVNVVVLSWIPQAWFGKFSEVVHEFGLKKSKCDHSVFYWKSTVETEKLAAKPCNTPMVPNVHLVKVGDPFDNPERYRRLVRKLNYFTGTRPDIAFAAMTGEQLADLFTKALNGPRVGTVAEPKAVNAAEPLLLDAVRGKEVERPPVWLMRQAGSCLHEDGMTNSFCFVEITRKKASEKKSLELSYQILCEKHPSFRERSENVDLVVEISLQPWKVFQPDGVILFSDILTPLSGMNIPFDIIKGKGPIIFDPPTTLSDVEKVREFIPEESVPYVGEALTILRKEVWFLVCFVTLEVSNQAAVLGFVGAPFTLASYVVEGGSSKNFTKIKRLAFAEPKVQIPEETKKIPGDSSHPS
ncbi:Uroporphyrinogen decarboxylase, chloroplastic [Capsicum baccatum]|uniref:Uroporphyrinogen decarboxylase, chloroplastic n=1 Tax=Capsicum baccatum TaxID=33114 RepID=A0A2G2WMK3_CAPBA|nr:Uroporphyrinogen decarboxylase, chloroplastic [Capsicum baccatum]